MPKIKKDDTLVPGALDLLVELEVKEEVLEGRQTGDKKKVEHKDKVEVEHFYADFGNEVTKEKAYRKVGNDLSV